MLVRAKNTDRKGWQEYMIKMFEKDGNLEMIEGQNGYKSGKQNINDFFTCQRLKNLKIGQMFALASVDGIRVFKMTEFSPYKETDKYRTS